MILSKPHIIFNDDLKKLYNVRIFGYRTTYIMSFNMFQKKYTNSDELIYVKRFINVSDYVC